MMTYVVIMENCKKCHFMEFKNASIFFYYGQWMIESRSNSPLQNADKSEKSIKVKRL